jgi:hypothetical protein
MQHLEGSGTPVLYIGRTVLKRSQYWYVKYITNERAAVKPMMTYESQYSHYLHLSKSSSLRDLALTFYLNYIIFKRYES